jgi:hypothetical protein
MLGVLGRVSAESLNSPLTFLLVRDQLEVDHLPLIEPAETGALDRRDMHKNVLTAALGLDEAVTLGRIEPFHGTCLSCSGRVLVHSAIAHAERKGAAEAGSTLLCLGSSSDGGAPFRALRVRQNPKIVLKC